MKLYASAYIMFYTYWVDFFFSSFTIGKLLKVQMSYTLLLSSSLSYFRLAQYPPFQYRMMFIFLLRLNVKTNL